MLSTILYTKNIEIKQGQKKKASWGLHSLNLTSFRRTKLLTACFNTLDINF